MKLIKFKKRVTVVSILNVILTKQFKNSSYHENKLAPFVNLTNIKCVEKKTVIQGAARELT